MEHLGPTTGAHETAEAKDNTGTPFRGDIIKGNSLSAARCDDWVLRPYELISINFWVGLSIIYKSTLVFQASDLVHARAATILVTHRLFPGLFCYLLLCLAQPFPTPTVVEEGFCRWQMFRHLQTSTVECENVI